MHRPAQTKKRQGRILDPEVVRMDARVKTALKCRTTYQILTSIFAVASVVYVWVCIDWYLDYKVSLGSSETVEVMGSKWPISTIHAMALGGWLMTAGPVAAGVLAAQLGSIWWFRPKRTWLVMGVIVCLICCFAIWSWIAN